MALLIYVPRFDYFSNKKGFGFDFPQLLFEYKQRLSDWNANITAQKEQRGRLKTMQMAGPLEGIWRTELWILRMCLLFIGMCLNNAC